jgi:hypothetical protein
MANERLPTRQERRVVAREARRAAQRAAAARQRQISEDTEPKLFRAKWGDTFSGAAIPLAVGGLMLENNLAVGICLGLAAAVACAPALTHHETPKKYRGAYAIAVLLICVVLFSTVRDQNLQKELAKNEGTLEAGNTPSSDNCGPYTIPNSIIVNAGSILLQITKFPYVLLTLNGERSIILDREPNGNLLIKRLLVLDDRSDMIVKIERDKYWVHPNSQWQHPSRSKIAVSDHLGREVLSLDFRNPNSLVFRAQINSEVVIKPDKRQILSFSVTDDLVTGRVDDGPPAGVSKFCMVDLGFALTPGVKALQLVPGTIR